MLPLFSFLRRITAPTLSPTPFFPLLEISLFWGDFIYPHHLSDSKGTSKLRGEKAFDWIISDILSLITLTLLPFSTAPLTLALPLTSPLLPSSLAPKRCFRTQALITSQFYQLSLFLPSFAATNALLPSIFRKLVGVILLLALVLTVLVQRNTPLFPLQPLSLPLGH